MDQFDLSVVRKNWTKFTVALALAGAVGFGAKTYYASHESAVRDLASVKEVVSPADDCAASYVAIQDIPELDAAQRFWAMGKGTPSQADLDYVVKNQTLINYQLEAAEKHTIETGTPPAPWNRGKTGMASFVRGMPESVKQGFVTKLLEKNATSPESAAKLIGSLEPEDGVRDAVVKFLAKSDFLFKPDSTSTFTEEQVRQMFEGRRFEKFFPWVEENSNLVVAPREKLLLAVRTSPLIPGEHSLDPSVLGLGAVDRKHYETEIPRSAVRSVIGYDPVVLPRMLKPQMEANFHLDGLTPDQQIRGLIVQGHYEKDGNSLYVDFSAKRGVADIESDVPKINRALKENLETGALSKQDPLNQRLFTYGWGMNSNPSLIASLRQTALRVAEQDAGFTKLRIEIHAFPTAELYGRVEAYITKYRASKGAKKEALKWMDQCLEEMQAVLGIGKNARGLDSVVAELKGPKNVVDGLKAQSSPFEDLPPTEKLDLLAKVRSDWHDQRLGAGTQSDRFDYYAGDRELAGLSMRVEKELIDTLPKNPQKQIGFVEKLSKQILNQVKQDDFLSDEQVKTITDQLDAIVADEGLAADRKLELLSDLLNNSVDQVYYKLKRPFGDLDERILRMASYGRETAPVRFLDGTLRSNNVFMLSQLVDAMEESALARKNIAHTIGNKTTRIPARVFNPGTSTGILRVNKNAMELTPNEIGVFSEMPVESGALGGIMTLGVGARLSHMQLLARSLKIPNVKFSSDAIELLKPYDGQMVRFVADKSGAVTIVPLKEGAEAGATKKKVAVKIPTPDHSVDTPLSFDEAGKKWSGKTVAGPKGMVLSELRQDKGMRDHVTDGFIDVFGYFRKYLKTTKQEPLVDTLGKVQQTNNRVVAELSKQIRDGMDRNPIPDKLVKETMEHVKALKKRTGDSGGNFVRSDTNGEDLPGFNGAGLNESVPNVKQDPKAMKEAVLTVWKSPFKEKSIFWRGLALGTKEVPLAEPSVVVMPTVRKVKASGVIISRGGPKWEAGRGYISANWGIGSVVEAGAPVEEITLESGKPHRFSMTSSATKPTESAGGGLKNVQVEPGRPVLTDDEVYRLRDVANQVEKILGKEAKGWDIEWCIDTDGKVWIVQARPNT